MRPAGSERGPSTRRSGVATRPAKRCWALPVPRAWRAARCANTPGRRVIRNARRGRRDRACWTPSLRIWRSVWQPAVRTAWRCGANCRSGATPARPAACQERRTKPGAFDAASAEREHPGASVRAAAASLAQALGLGAGQVLDGP